MNKKELITAIKEKTEVSKKDIETILAATEEVVKETIASGDKVTVLGVQFSTRVQAAREGVIQRNNGEIKNYSSPEKTVPKLKATKTLKDAVL